MKELFFCVVLTLIGNGALFAQGLSDAGITPENYQLKLTPDLEKATFTGEEVTRLKVAKPIQAIVLNAAEIQFQSVSVTAGGKTQQATVTTDDKKEQATFTLPAAIPA